MSGQDSENEAVAYKPALTRAIEWADDIRTRPLTDEQAIDLAGVYASIAAVEAHERIAEALEALEPLTETLREPLERLLAIAALSGIATAPEAGVSEHETHQSETETP